MTDDALAPRAKGDLLEIGGYIATFDPDAALRLEERFRTVASYLII